MCVVEIWPQSCWLVWYVNCDSNTSWYCRTAYMPNSYRIFGCYWFSLQTKYSYSFERAASIYSCIRICSKNEKMIFGRGFRPSCSWDSRYIYRFVVLHKQFAYWRTCCRLETFFPCYPSSHNCSSCTEYFHSIRECSYNLISLWYSDIYVFLCCGVCIVLLWYVLI